MQKINKRTVTLGIIFLLILVVVALLIGNFTFSFLGADIGDDVVNQGETTASGDTIIFTSGNTLSLHATTDNFNATSGNLTDTTNPSARLIASSKTNEAASTYYAGVRINENTYTYSSGTTADVILTVKDESGENITTSSDNNLTYVTVTDASGASISGFDITGKIGAFNIVAEHPISTTSSTTGTTQTWTFILTFVNYTYDQSINENASLDMEVILQKDEILPLTFAETCTPGTMACDIARLYTVDGENGLYYHDTDLANGAQDNSYRYSGSNDVVNNYVCFGPGAEGEETCANDNLYRIIGLFDDDNNGTYQVKLIKSDYTTSDMLGTDGRDYYGAYSNSTSNYKGSMDTSTIAVYRWNYDTSVSEYGSNNWTTSEFNKINLNTNYWNYLGSTWQKLITPTTWHLGGMTSDRNTAKAFYDGERNDAGYESNPTTYNDEIGLMYPSDYGYAASPDAWTNNLVDYDNSTITANNWLYMGLFEWSISPYSSYSNYVFYVNSNGYLYLSNAHNGNSARPVFYLESNVQLEGGSGTSNDPYTLAV